MKNEYVLKKLEELEKAIENISDEDLRDLCTKLNSTNEEIPVLDTVQMLRES